jgi:hypothetical protein
MDSYRITRKVPQTLININNYRITGKIPQNSINISIINRL